MSLIGTMKSFDVVPGIGVGPVRLGMSRKEARNVMDTKPMCFNKTGTSIYETDAFYRGNFQIFYEGDNPRVKYIELSASGGFDAFYRGRNVFKTRATDLVAFITQDTPLDETDPELGYSFIFPALELSLWRPVRPEAEEDAEGQFFMAIGIGVKGYYSRTV